MTLAGLLARAFAITLLTGTVLLPLADHHTASHPDVGRMVLHHHSGAAADPAERGTPLVTPGAASGLAVGAAIAPIALALPTTPGPTGHRNRWQTIEPSPPALLLEPPPAPPPNLPA